MSAAEQLESPESRLLGAGFTCQLGWWSPPGDERTMQLEDAIAALDRGEIQPAAITVPDTGVRAFPDDLVDRMFDPLPSPTPFWLPELADLVAKKLKPVVRAEVRAELRKGRSS